MVSKNNVAIYQAFFEHAFNAMFILSDDAKIIEANLSASTLLQQPKKALIGKLIWQFMPEKHKKRAKQNWQKFLSTQQQEGLFSVIDQAGEEHFTEYRVIANIEPGKHMGIIRDITKQLDMVAELKQTEARYKYLTTIYPVGIFHTNIHGQNIYINEKATEIMDITYEESMGDGWAKNLHPDDAWIKDFWQHTVSRNDVINQEYRFLHKDGTVVWVKGQSVPEISNNEIIGYVGSLTDITKLRNAEAEIRQNQIEIAHYSRVTSMGEIVSGIAHELNQPLTAIANYAHGCIRRLNTSDVAPEITETIVKIARQAERAGEVIHHLKNFLRKGTPKKSACDVNLCIDNVLQIISGMAKSRRISIKLHSDPQLPIIQADNISIEQVVMNLITNAIEAMEELMDADKHIIIHTFHDETNLFIEVEDNGLGVAASVIDNIFNPFITTKISGMGIGLSLSRNIIEMHNGTLTMEAVKPHGAKFIIQLAIKG